MKTYIIIAAFLLNGKINNHRNTSQNQRGIHFPYIYTSTEKDCDSN